MEKKRILLNDNAELAERHIADITEHLKQPLETIVYELRKMEIGTPTKEMILDVLHNNCAETIARYNTIYPICNNDPRITKVLNEESNQVIAHLHKIAENVKSSTIFTGMKLSNPVIADYFEVDEAGQIIISESYIETIKEDVKEYIQTPKGIKIWELRHIMMQAMKKIYEICIEIEESKTEQLPFGLRMAMRNFPLGLYEVSQSRGSGKLEFKETPLNFDPEPKEEDDE